MSEQRPDSRRLDSDRSVKPFELFFDLVFVFAFTQVTQLLASELSWGGLGQGVLLLAALWLAWQSYVWLGTQIDLDEGAVRLAIIAVMGGMLAGALAVPGAFGDTAILFAAAYAFVRVFQVVLFAIAARKIDGLFRATLILARGAVPGPTIALVGAVSGWGPLEAWWAGALLLEYTWFLMMDISGFKVSPHHFSERHGLIFIIALGEAVISIGIGASGLAIDSEVVMRLLVELLQLALIDTTHPTRGRNLHRLKARIYPILLAQAMRHNLELERPDCAEDEVVVA